MKLFKRNAATDSVGAQMEDAAAHYLQNAGLIVEARNYRSHQGEIDLIARDGEMLVFVEVRYRRDNRYGTASATVDRRKQSKLMATANSYLQQHKLDCPCRFDVIAIDGDAKNIQWITGAFET